MLHANTHSGSWGDLAVKVGDSVFGC